MQCRQLLLFSKGVGVKVDISLAIKYYFTLSAEENDKVAVIAFWSLLSNETKRGNTYLFQAIYRAKQCIKLMDQSDEVIPYYNKST